MCIYHLEERDPESDAIDNLKRLVSLGTIDIAVCLSIRADTLSIKTSRFSSVHDHSSSVICFSAQSMEIGQVSGLSEVGLLSE